jgi:hypothetical protein
MCPAGNFEFDKAAEGPAARTVIADQLRHRADRQERAHGFPCNDQDALPAATAGPRLTLRASERQAGKTQTPAPRRHLKLGMSAAAGAFLLLVLRWTLYPRNDAYSIEYFKIKDNVCLIPDIRIRLEFYVTL